MVTIPTIPLLQGNLYLKLSELCLSFLVWFAVFRDEGMSHNPTEFLFYQLFTKTNEHCQNTTQFNWIKLPVDLLCQQRMCSVSPPFQKLMLIYYTTLICFELFVTTSKLIYFCCNFRNLMEGMRHGVNGVTLEGALWSPTHVPAIQRVVQWQERHYVLWAGRCDGRAVAWGAVELVW